MRFCLFSSCSFNSDYVKYIAVPFHCSFLNSSCFGASAAVLDCGLSSVTSFIFEPAHGKT